MIFAQQPIKSGKQLGEYIFKTMMERVKQWHYILIEHLRRFSMMKMQKLIFITLFWGV
jgi:hypothetical protein